VFHFSSIAVVIPFIVAVFAAPNPASAVTLAELFAGATISAGNLTFSDWKFLDLDSEGGGLANPAQIDVFPLNNDPLNPGIRYSLFFGLETAKNSPVPSLVEMTYSFRITKSGPPIENTTVQITSFDASARAGSRVRVIQTVERTGGSYLSQVVAFARPTDTLETPNLLAFENLAIPRSTTIVETALAAGGASANDYMALREFEQRFGSLTTVPEPGAAALIVLLFSSTAALRFRRRT
jgi:hypothetical protein